MDVKNCIELTIPGLPVSQPRQRHAIIAGSVRNFTPANHPVQSFKSLCRLVASQKFKRPLPGPIEVEIAFYFPRPASKVWKTKPMPLEVKTSKPDLDNLAKAVMDSLNGVCWIDDAQVCRIVLSKWIVAGGDPVQSVIKIKEVSNV
jgi:Holliday junction resolvase RusA-like endonuclease